MTRKLIRLQMYSCLISTIIVTMNLSVCEVLARVGDWGDPIEITSLPFIHHSNTQPRPPSRIDRYSCAPNLSESGPEVVYQVSINQTGILSAIVEGDQGTVDIDVHLLSDAQLNGSEAAGCIARDNSALEQSLSPGSYLITVDTFQQYRSNSLFGSGTSTTSTTLDTFHITS